MVQPYVIKPLTHERIALIGLTQSPAGLAYLPHLKEQLTGIRIQPPHEAVSQWLPKAQAESDRVILLYYGTLTGLQPIREQFGNAFAAILVGGSRPDDLPADVEPPVIGTSARGRHVAHLRLPSPGGGAKGEVTQVAIEPMTAPDDTIATLMNQAKGGGASGARFEHGRPEVGQPSERSTAGETAAQQTQAPKGGGQQGQEEAPSAPALSLLERGRNTPDTPSPIIIGDSLQVGMPLPDALMLLGAMGSVTVEQGTTFGVYHVRMEYPAHGLVIFTQGLVVDAIEVRPAFTGQFASGVRIGDPVTAILAAYGKPASMTPERAVYPDQGFVFTFDDAKLIGATVSPPVSRPPEKPADSSGTSPTEEKPSSPHGPDVISLPFGSGEDPRKGSGAPTPEQEMTGSTAEPAVLVEQSDVPRGFNIALAALGGRVVQATSQLNETTWAAANLTDGVAFTPTYTAVEPDRQDRRQARRRPSTSPSTAVDPRDVRRICDPSCGWSSKDKILPQEIVLAFHQGREARIHAVVIDTATYSAAVEGRVDNLPKHVEIWASTTGATAGFTKITGARLQPRTAQYLIRLPPTRAKYLKVRFLSNHGGDATTAAEIRVLEAGDGAASILRDVPKNLALPTLGGAVVRLTSAVPDAKLKQLKVGPLVDNSPAREGWRSTDGYLPQEFVFAFPGDQAALIDQIVLHPTTSHDPSTWPKRIAVSVSSESPLDGFEEAGQFDLLQKPQEQAFPIGRRARFLRLRILENFGGHYTSLGKIKVIEGSAADYESVLREPSASVVPQPMEATVTSPGTALHRPMDEPEVIVEREPNGTPAEANTLELDRTTRGVIDPLGEEDYFKLSVPGKATSVLTLELLGRPNIRTSVTLFDAAGTRLKRFDPGATPAQQAMFSWALGPGEHLLQVTEPPISMVLIWDTSSSMQGSTEDLRRAVEGYLDQVRPSERLNLLRFSNPRLHKLPDVEVLLPGFTSDRARLKAATAGKFFADGGTPLYDAIGKGIELLEGVEGNRAIVVMTDGADSTSRLGHPGFWRLLQEKRIRLYAIGFGFDLHAYQPTFASNGERILKHAAMATNGCLFLARTAEELQRFYQRVADELRTVSSYDVRPTLSRGTGSLDVVATGERIPKLATPQLELMLDASSSMKEKLKGKGLRKIDIAKEAMAQIIEGLPDDLPVALRVFGHRIRERQPGDCQDSELIVPFAPLDKPHLLNQVRAIQALGTTPIAYSLQQVEHDFGGAPGEKIVILITDGKEECKGNPSAVVSEMLAKGFRVRLHIVGFALSDEATKRELQQLAERTGGRFADTKDAEALHGAIEQALAVPYDVLDAAGSRVASGLTGHGAIAVPEGVYTIVVHAAGQPITIADVRVAHDQFTRVELKKEGQEVGTQVLGPVQRYETPWAAEAKAAPSTPRRK